jgi:hypothetical protein
MGSAASAPTENTVAANPTNRAFIFIVVSFQLIRAPKHGGNHCQTLSGQAVLWISTIRR